MSNQKNVLQTKKGIEQKGRGQTSGERSTHRRSEPFPQRLHSVSRDQLSRAIRKPGVRPVRRRLKSRFDHLKHPQKEIIRKKKRKRHCMRSSRTYVGGNGDRPHRHTGRSTGEDDRSQVQLGGIRALRRQRFLCELVSDKVSVVKRTDSGVSFPNRNTTLHTTLDSRRTSRTVPG